MAESVPRGVARTFHTYACIKRAYVTMWYIRIKPMRKNDNACVIETGREIGLEWNMHTQNGRVVDRMEIGKNRMEVDEI